jgi:hypothetical protein
LDGGDVRRVDGDGGAYVGTDLGADEDDGAGAGLVVEEVVGRVYSSPVWGGLGVSFLVQVWFLYDADVGIRFLEGVDDVELAEEGFAAVLLLDVQYLNTVFPRSFDHHSWCCLSRLPPGDFLYKNLVDPTRCSESALLYIFKAA